MFRCRECKFKTRSKGYLNIHNQDVHNDSTKQLNKRYNLRPRKKNIPEESEKVVLFMCDVCPFQTKYKSSLKRHQKNPNIHKKVLPATATEKVEDRALPELTEDQLQTVDRAFKGKPDEIVKNKFGYLVTRAEIQDFKESNWLNDNVINFYMKLIMQRGRRTQWPSCYTVSTFFYVRLTNGGPESVIEVKKNENLAEFEFICVPIHLQRRQHWCMAIIATKEKVIMYYDSLGSANQKCFLSLREYLEFKKIPNAKDFKVKNVGLPRQTNGSDCGVFACTFAEFITRKAKVNFTQKDMPYFRKKMAFEILNGQLLTY